MNTEIPFRYQGLGYLKLRVTDVIKTKDFLMDVLCLDLVPSDRSSTLFFRTGPNHHDIIIEEAAEAALVRVAWSMPSEAELQKAFAHFESKGRKPQWVNAEELSELYIRKAFRIVDPILRACWEYYVDMTYLWSPRQNQITSFEGGKHFGIMVPDARSTSRHLIDEMNFRVSDFFEGEGLSLLRAWPNPNHHSIATLQSPNNTAALHHIALMVNEIDDIGRLYNRAARYDAKIQFGIGRHPTSGSIHLYLYGPDNYIWEYTFGMEQFPEHGARAARCMSAAPGDFDLWNAIPDTQRYDDLPGLILSN